MRAGRLQPRDSRTWRLSISPSPRLDIGRKYAYGHLGWFFRQWVYEANLPNHRLEYKIENQPDGKALLKEMPLPLVLKYRKGQAEFWLLSQKTTTVRLK